MAMPDGVSGFVKPGYEGVADAFADNLSNGREIGAAFAAYRGAEPLVDIWGGQADRASGRPWDKDTLQLIFSGTKGMVAICVMMLIDRGLVDLDAPVSRYWPAFGKPEVLVRNIVSHTARLPGLTTPLSQKGILDDRYIGKLLEAQPVFTDPRAVYTYHGLTYGWLCGELVRHVDGRSIGKFFAEEIAAPLGLEFWIGLPEREEPRVSTIEMTDAWANNPMFAPPAPNLSTENPVRFAAWCNPQTLGRDVFMWNRREVHASELPAGGGIGTARAVARAYAELASEGGQLMRPKTAALANQTLSDGEDTLLFERRRNGIGFQLQTEINRWGPYPDGFGHDGAGGSAHGCWPSEGVGFSYAMNLLWDGADGPVRYGVLLDALAKAVREGRSAG
jgi:CubicO group peptidase (beta-lactamase class C family)